MILIADSGATKTEWRIVKNTNDISQALTEGISPQYENENQIAGKLRLAVEKNVLPEKVDVIYFYGAGCSSKLKKETVKKALQMVINTGKAEIYSDVTGVARSLCGNEKGIAAILGTGSSSCFYDGKEVEVKVPSLGYILGDEGSGAHLGKLFLGKILRSHFSEKITTDFEKTYQLDLEKVLFALRNEAYPSRYLASFATFIHRHKQDRKMYQLIHDSFSEFCENYIIPYQKHECPAHFCGSVAFHFSDILARVCNAHNIRVGNIAKSPIAGLTLYHSAN